MSKKSAPLTTAITSVGFSKAITNCLMADGITTLGDLVTKTEIAIMKIPGLGRTRVKELVGNLKVLGLELQPKAHAFSKLGLSSRAANALRYAGIRTVIDLIHRTEADLRKVPELGVVSIDQIKKGLSEMNLKLKEPT
jgi:DNA-directed RNA polymerase alpha subunit